MEVYEQRPIEHSKLQQLIIDAKDFLHGQGAVFRTSNNPSSADVVTMAPVTVLPSPVLFSCFEQARLIQTDLNLLMHRVAGDHEFLRHCLKSVFEVDDFTKRLWNICETVHKSDLVKPITLALNRSDYMIEAEPEPNADGVVNGTTDHTDLITCDKCVARGVALKQVEFNTISAASAGMSPKITAYHRYSLSRCSRNNSSNNSSNVPENNATAGSAKSLVTAHHLYGNSNAIIVFLVYEHEENVYDQRTLEYAIYNIDNKIQIVRRTLKDLQSRLHLTDDRRLTIDNMEIAIVYMRCGYKPSDYDCDDVWKTRLMMESSRAIVCPTAAYQLAGTKKIQQVLSAPGMVERFIEDLPTVQRIRAIFAEQYSLDLDEEGDRNAQMGIENPKIFVLKPQREGGGNNTFGDEIRNKLTELAGSTTRCSFVLMKRIHPVVAKNYPIALGKSVEMRDMVSELGIYGSLVANGADIVRNEQHGYLMRTKPRGTDEGGIALGCSVYDSPYLVSGCPSQHLSRAGLEQ